MPTDLTPLIAQMEFASRLEFLYKVVEDTQGTIRFIDTKAAFCVTLLSGMVAGVLQKGHWIGGGTRHWAFVVFMVLVNFSLVICLRVIFPMIKPAGSMARSAVGPKFFIGHNKAHHWVLHTVLNKMQGVLCETHESYVAAFEKCSDADLVSSMCEEVLMISVIRQLKSDRLHAAMFCIGGTVVAFAVVMLS